MGKALSIPSTARASAMALGVPRAAKVVMYYGLSGGALADMSLEDIGPRRRLGQGFAEEKSGGQPDCRQTYQAVAGTK
jgi:hypothetical protein